MVYPLPAQDYCGGLSALVDARSSFPCRWGGAVSGSRSADGSQLAYLAAAQGKADR